MIRVRARKKHRESVPLRYAYRAARAFPPRLLIYVIKPRAGKRDPLDLAPSNKLLTNE